MKKVLVISFFFNNKEEIGSVRLRGLARNLPEYGWKPTILTIKNRNESESHFRTVETDYSDLVGRWESRLGLNSENIKKKSNKNGKNYIGFLIKAWLEIFAFPDPEKNWYKPAVEVGSDLLEKEQFDAILTSSSPVTCHLIGAELKKRHEIPWIADFRDLWTQNPYFNHTFMRRIVEKRLELKTIRNADAITTTTEYFERELKQLHNTNKTHVILNGFSPSDKTKNAQLINKFTIIYTGRLYYGKRDPEPVFKALCELINQGDIDSQDVKIEFYGPHENWLFDDVKKYNLENLVQIYGILPREKILEKQREAQLLLLLAWDNPKEKGIIPGKIFEYMAARRPILFIGNSSSRVNDIIKTTNIGETVSGNEEIKNTLLKLYNEFKTQGKVNYNGIQEQVDIYSQIEMTKKFSKVLDKVTDDN